jgi:sterol desaturase/sphingolipid hydroxylase (fatty acid hydroxylase superfamily)
MAAILYYAIPFFVLLLVAEYASFRHLDHDDEDADGPVGYELRDTGTSLAMGLGNVTINVVWKLVVVAIYAALYKLTPLRLDPRDPLTWVALFFADDLAYYWFHRVSHESRFFWASHVVHHSSRHFNLSTALRQTWVPMTYFPFWLALPLLGFPVWMVLLAQAWSLIYQFWIHTERIVRLPRVVEAIFNTPSHHRVHHGTNHQYLDRNYGGILIVWDRLFGTWEPEGERVRYGLTTQLRTFHPVRVAFHEYLDIARDLRAVHGWRMKVQVLLRGPGWSRLVVSSARSSGSGDARSPLPPRRARPRATSTEAGHAAEAGTTVHPPATHRPSG